MKPTGKRYNSLRDLIRDTAEEDEKEFVEAFESRSARREITKHLMALRASQGKSQSDIAQSFGCSQSRISKLESSLDGDLRLGDIDGYLEAMNLEMRLVITKRDLSVMDEIKYYWACLCRQFSRLLDMAHEDPAAAVRIGKFSNEIATNYMGEIADFIDKLPLVAKKKAPRIEIEEIGLDCVPFTQPAVVPDNSSPGGSSPAVA